MVKNGSGALTLTAVQTYTGDTTINGGILALSGGDNRLNSASGVNFAGGTLDIGSISQTIANLNAISGANAITGHGHLTHNGGDLLVSNGATLDLSGLSNFTYNSPNHKFGATNGTLILAQNNQITASEFDVATATSSATATVRLGQTNVINADTLNVGAVAYVYEGGVNGTLNFQTGLVAPTLVLRGTAGGSSRMNITVGSITGSDYGIGSSLVDLTSGVTNSTLDAMVGTMMLGRYSIQYNNQNHYAYGTFNMGNGTMDATTMILGQNNDDGYANGYQGVGKGIFALNGGTLKVQNVILGDDHTNAGTTGIFNLNSGTLQAQNIQIGAGSATRTFNWNGGSIQNYASGTGLTINTGVTLAVAAGGSPTFNITSGDTATINTPITGAGGITVSSGTVLLTTANSYQGGTTITGGTLRLFNGAAATPTTSGMKVWLNADNLTGTGDPANGATVNTWTNLAPSGTSAGNFTGTASYITSDSSLNGQGAVHFTGGNGLSNSTNFGNNVTVIYVGRMDGTNNHRLLSATGNNWLLGYWGGDMNEAYFNSWLSNPGTAANTSAHLFEGTVDASGNAVFYNDGTTLAAGGGFAGPNGLSIGTGGLASSENSSGDIGELLVYNSVLSLTDRQNIEAYLNYKWFGQNTQASLPTTTAMTITGGTLDLNGVNQSVAGLSGAGSGNVSLGSGKLTVASAVNTAFAGVISGSGGGIIKQGSGALTLSGANTYSGGTTVSGGTLLVNGSLSSSSAVNVASGATLAGTGTVSGNVTLANGGILSAGISGSGILNAGNLTLASGSNFNVDINSSIVGTGYDQLNVTGTVNLNGRLPEHQRHSHGS